MPSESLGQQSYAPIGVSPDWFLPWSKEVKPRNLVSELFTQGSVGGAAGNCCLYPASRIGKRRFYRIGWACESHKMAECRR